jgi:hypothetical protein
MRTRAAVGFVVGCLGAVLALTVVAVPGCGGGGAATCDVGKEGCPCTGGGACNTGLTCASNKCVNPSAADGGVDSGGGDSSGGSTDPNVACADVSKMCAKLNACAPLLVSIVYGTVEACTTRFKLSCIDAFKAADSGLTAASIAACSAALPGASCEDVLYRKLSACNAKGKRTNGTACGTDEQCATGYCTHDAAACGVCADFVGAGSSCTQDDDCEPGLVCSNDSHCVVPGAAGTTCSDNQPCKYGFYCRGGSCVATKATAGASCQDIGSCELLKGIYCNTTVQTCQKIGAAMPGEPCGSVNSSFVLCAAGDCVFANTGIDLTGVCAMQAGDGQSCGAQASNGAGCQAPARCLSNRCALPNSNACQ